MKQKKVKPQRKDWNSYFLDLAKVISTRATCDRLLVGAVIVENHRILATGYNGSLPRAPHCDDVGHLMVHGHCKRTIHAEINAIAQAASNGISIKDSTIYITHSPCLECFKSIVASGIRRIYFDIPYRLDEKLIDVYKQVAGYNIINIESDEEKVYLWEVNLNNKIWYKV